MITLRFSRGDSFAATLVRLETVTGIGSCAFRLQDASLVDVTPRYGVVRRWCSKDRGPFMDYAIVAPQEKVNNAVTWALAQSGKDYDWSALTGMTWQSGRLRRREWWDDRRWSPAELIVAAMESVGERMLDDQNNRTRILPCHLMESPKLRRIAI